MLQINSEMFAQIMERFDRIERGIGAYEQAEGMPGRRHALGQLRPVPAARHHQTHAGALPPEEARDLLHD